MSFDALAWASKQQPGKMAAKMVLLCLANYANEDGEAYPSTAAIAEFGDMNHKTATSALDRLEELGLISDTGSRRGKSGQIKVYRLHLGASAHDESWRPGSFKAPENTPPKKGGFPKPPKNSAKAPRKREVEASRKRVTDTVIEPVMDPVRVDGLASVDHAAGKKSDGLPRISSDEMTEAWNNLADRIGRPRIRSMTPERRRKLSARINGHTVEDFKEVLANIERSAFLSGDKGCFVTFDWVMTEGNFLKILEGNYNDEVSRTGRHPGQPQKPSLAGGSLFEQLQAGKISETEFHAARARLERKEAHHSTQPGPPADHLLRGEFAAPAREGDAGTGVFDALPANLRRQL